MNTTGSGAFGRAERMLGNPGPYHTFTRFLLSASLVLGPSGLRTLTPCIVPNPLNPPGRVIVSASNVVNSSGGQVITLSQQNGGPEICEDFNQSVLWLRKKLETLQSKVYAPSVAEFALILRVDGSLTKFGTQGVEEPRFRKAYAQVDIVISESQWRAPTAAHRQYLVSVVEDALAKIADRLQERKRPINRMALMADYTALCRDR
jgi:hypothetical protein